MSEANAIESPKVLVIGAHPDDAEVKAAGTALQWRRLGIDVTFVSTTDGRAGHHLLASELLVERRKLESGRAAQVLDVKSIVMGFPDGKLTPSLEARLEVIRLIRRERPQLVLTHRLWDYHPDHRATGQLVQDASYLISVPHVAPDAPPLLGEVVFGFLSDRFTRPCPFRADVVVDIQSDLDTVIESLDAHESQFYEWLPWNMGILSEVPSDPELRRKALKQWYVDQYALRHRDVAPGGSDRLVEAFEISEYGAPLTDRLRKMLFRSPTDEKETSA